MIRRLQRLKAKRGFTLVELIVVIAIIGVLAAILVPTLAGVIENARKRSVESTCHSIQNISKTYATQYIAKTGLGYDPNDEDAAADMDDGKGKVSLTKFIENQLPEIVDSKTKGTKIVVVDGKVDQVIYTEGDFSAAWNIDNNVILTKKNAYFKAAPGKVDVVSERVSLPEE